MNHSLPRIVCTMMLLLIAGCSSKGEINTAKSEPSRSREVTFNSMTISQVKNNIMAACSARRLQIHTSKDEVTCAQNDITGTRKRDLERFVNDEYATNIQIVSQFKLAELDNNINVTANIYTQYLAPVSVTSGPQTRTRNLIDDISFNEMSSLLEQASNNGKSVK